MLAEVFVVLEIQGAARDVAGETAGSQQAPFAPDSVLTNEEIEQRNVEVITAHCHNENPDTVVNEQIRSTSACKVT